MTEQRVFGPRRFERSIDLWFRKRDPNKIPTWTPEDEENLRRRVARIAAREQQ